MENMSFVDIIDQILNEQDFRGHSTVSTECWLRAWRALATATNGLRKDDPRVRHVLAALDACDGHFAEGNYQKFMGAARSVERAMGNQSKSQSLADAGDLFPTDTERRNGYP